MDFRRRAIIELLGKLIAAALSITLAIETDSYWAMAAGTICSPAVMLILSYAILPTRPRFSLAGWRMFSNMTVWSFFSQSIAAINWQIDRMILPIYVDTASFGRFATANTLAELPYQAVVAPTSAPLFSALVSAKERGNLRSAYLKGSSAIVLFMAPVLFFLAFMAGPIITILLGPSWIEAAPVLSGLALTGVISLQTVPMPSLAMALDQTRNVAMRATIEMLIRIPLSLSGIALFGVNGAIAAKACAAAGVLVTSLVAVRKLADIPIADQIKVIVRPMVAMLPALVVLYCAHVWMDLSTFLYLKIVVVGIFYGLTYVFGLYLAWIASGRPVGLEADVFNTASKLMQQRLKPT